MLKTLGVEDRREVALLLAIIALVAISPLGREGTAAHILVTYRLLLIAITIGSLIILKDRREPEVCPIFVGLCGTALLLMLVSVLWNSGLRFEGFYLWHQHLLFGAAVISLAAMNRQRSKHWKQTILWAVIGIDLLYLAATLIMGQRPLMGPFVNPNYFASFLLVGFAGAVAIAGFDKRSVIRIAATGCALLLYFGMTQAWSRGAALAAMGVTVLSVIRFTQGRGISRTKIGIIVGVALAAGAVASPTLIRKFLDRGQIDPYNYQRPRLWMSALHVIGEHPVLGVGLAEFHHVSMRFSPPVEGTVARYLKRPGIAHSEYLQYAAESGIPAALLLFGLAGYLTYLAMRRAKTCGLEQRVFQEAAILTAAGLGIHALVDNNWDVPVMAAGLVVFSLAEVLPLREWHLNLRWSPRAVMICAMLLGVLLIHAVAIPGLAVHFNESGLAAYTHGDIDRAESQYRLAAAIAPNTHVFLDNAGTVYFEKFMKSQDRRWLNFAETLFTQASLANPNSDQAANHLERALIQHLTGDPAKDHAVHLRIAAVDRSILAIDPFNPFVRKNLAEALYNSGSREAAEKELLRAIELEPNYVPGYLRLSDWFREAGNLAASEDYRQKGLAIVLRYRDVHLTEPYESILLGRPIGPERGSEGPSVRNGNERHSGRIPSGSEKHQ